MAGTFVVPPPTDFEIAGDPVPTAIFCSSLADVICTPFLLLLFLYAQLIMTQTHSGLDVQTLKEIELGKPFRFCDFLHSVTYMQPTFLAFIRTLLQRNSILPWTFQRQRRCLFAGLQYFG